MRLGIDFGTTRTVVAVADRGNYPVIGFHSETDDLRLWYPSLVAARQKEMMFAWNAEARHGEPGWSFLRSMKRLLSRSGPDSLVKIGEVQVPVLELLTRYLLQLRTDLQKRSNLELRRNEPLEAWIAVPANANSNQRFLTIEGFRRAGFRVLGLINEPSAAGIEYAQRYAPKSGFVKRECLVVYDLGGGTFDASVISMRERAHEILGNEGIAELGGDDFDETLLKMALDAAESNGDLDENSRYVLLEECRMQKEGLHPNTRKIAVDLSAALKGSGEVMLLAEDYYHRCAPLVERTISSLEEVVHNSLPEATEPWNEVAAVYLVGGASDLPVVGRLMRDRYGRRVRRSPYPYAATAIGLAILADTDSGILLKERFTRHFGVWREAESGTRIIFDPIFPKGTVLPQAGSPPLVRTRSYSPAHTVGHYRYLECTQVDEYGQPAGDLMPWDEIYFPLDPELRNQTRWDASKIHRSTSVLGQQIEERYECDSGGIISVTVRNLTSDYQKTFRLKKI